MKVETINAKIVFKSMNEIVVCLSYIRIVRSDKSLSTFVCKE